jgi:hypothetical protein
MGLFRQFTLGAGMALFAALPGTSNYQLHDYGFGNGGGTASSSNYSVEGIAGEIGQDGATNTYGLRAGLLGTQLANVPEAPTLTNPSDWYNKLHLVLTTSGNANDTTYAIAISSDSFATTQYVQDDHTVSSALGPEDFQDYTTWGGASGFNIIGLRPDTTYEVKVKARQGEFSESAFGPSASEATAQVSLTFDIDVANTDSESAPPYNLDFGIVSSGSVVSSPDKIWLDIASNADNGAFVYVVSQNNGLLSPTTSYTISSVTGDLSSLSEGLGAQKVSVAQSAGGPLAAESPYDGTSDNIGAIDTQYRQLLASSAPITDGRASFLLKIKTTSTTPAASDYTDIYTLVASAAF